MIAGYGAREFAESFADFGTPVALPASGAHLLRLPLPDGRHDYVGPYPYVVARDWARFADDLAGLDGVAAVCVADPFATGLDALAGRLDLLRPFKKHYVVALVPGWRDALRPQIRRDVRRGMKRASVTVAPASAADVDTFAPLYGGLIARHAVTGMAAATPAMLARQLAVPGALLVTARDEAGAATCQLFGYADAGVLHIYLVATSERGYRDSASHAVYFAALEWAEAEGLSAANLGGNAGAANDDGDGLASFKRGFANAERWSHLVGKVLDRAAYDTLSAGFEGDYFPAYRAPRRATATDEESR